MFQRAFVATTVALGGTLDDALAALPESAPETMRMIHARPSPLDELVAGLRARTRPARATALAQALRDVFVAVDEMTLR
ncbi:MAG: hypothetical protein KIT84_04535 [Labilithrix sp.]|nr:hypothetical protein [Labilithrix sp.]MCW5810253.1 hypothetical protein [Labilithrix sp.]